MGWRATIRVGDSCMYLIMAATYCRMQGNKRAASNSVSDSCTRQLYFTFCLIGW